MFSLFGKRRIYLDYAAATPVSKAAVLAMRQYFADHFGNPSAIYVEGETAKKAVAGSRESIADLLFARPDEIIFTSGGTEANNLAIMGSIEGLRKEGRAYNDMHVITSAIEHPSVSGAIKEVEKRGVKVTILKVNEDGFVQGFSEALTPQTVLVSIALVNGDIGVIQDIKKISHAIRLHRREHNSHLPHLHTDASQAPLYIECHTHSLGVDLLTIDAAKMYGPKGIGALYCRRKTKVEPILFGGSQEKERRPGTEAVPLIVGFGVAAAEAKTERVRRAMRATVRQTYFTLELVKHIPGVVFNGSFEQRIANNVHVSIPGIDGEFAVVVLDEAGIAAATRSACLGADGTGSNTVRELGKDEVHAKGSLRFSFNHETSMRDIRATVKVLAAHVKKQGQIS